LQPNAGNPQKKIMTDTPPPILHSPPAPRKTFYHQAATCSLLAPFFAIVVNILIMASHGNRLPTRDEVSVTGMFTSLILLAGFLLGIISLFGLRRYGKKGILCGRPMALCPGRLDSTARNHRKFRLQYEI
jgi:hypothetical protein